MNPLTFAPEVIPDLIARLTPRQLEIVALLAEGHSDRITGTILSISREAVKRNVYRARRKTNLNRVQLIVMFVKWKERGNPVTNP